MKKSILLLTLIVVLHGICTRVLAQETIIQYLSGTDKDHPVSWEFNCTKGRNSGTWTNIPVPSLWEQQGFGTAGSRDNSSEKGQYRIAFPSDKDWQNKRAFLVFEGVMTDAEIRLNGKPLGEGHQGSFTQFSYEITSFLRYTDPNLLEVTVTKASSNASIDRVEKAGDFPAFGGIFRPVYVKVVPDAYVERVAIDAKANGNFSMNVVSHNTKPNQTIEVQIVDLQGKDIGAPFQVNAADNAEVKKQFSVFKTWNPELPHLYQAVVSIKDGTNTIHTFRQKFGFRTIENQSDGLYLNGTKVVFKGLNRRFSETGLLASADAYAADINMMKDMNMNAVRISNFPADQLFLDMCDSLGLLVINELTSPAQPGYDGETNKKLIKDLVAANVNHPSVVMWANDIEKDDKEYNNADLQQRLVIHPVAGDSKKNADFSSLANSILYGTEAYYPSEFSKGLYNGGRAAGLDDFWSEMSKNSKFGGDFLWSYRDEIGADADAPDPKQHGANFYTIRDIWSPVVFESATPSFSGTLNVENRYLFTNLNKCRFDWKLVLYPKATQKTTNYTILGEGTAVAPFIGPSEKGSLKITLPTDYARADALMLMVYDGRNKEIYSQTFAIRQPADVMKTYPEVASISTIMETVDTNFHSIVCDGINYIFDKKSGNITKVYVGKRDLPFYGPFLAGTDQTMTEFKHTEKDRVHTVEVTYKGENTLYVKWTFKTGDLPKMEYQYSIKAPVDYTGITFRYPEEKVVGIKWMGRGPWQVWKNRSKGELLGVWEKSNKPSASGELPKNAEFKGYHGDIYWVQFQTNMGNWTVYNETPGMYLQLFSPMRQATALGNEFSNPPFPENGNISFMHSIASIGTKFQPSDSKQSKSLKSVPSSDPLSGTLWFDFRW